MILRCRVGSKEDKFLSDKINNSRQLFDINNCLVNLRIPKEEYVEYHIETVSNFGDSQNILHKFISEIKKIDSEVLKFIKSKITSEQRIRTKEKYNTKRIDKTCFDTDNS